MQVDYAKAAPDDILMRVTVINRGPDTASIHVLPQLLARNTWSWSAGGGKPQIASAGAGAVLATRPGSFDRRFEALQPVAWLFCENETNTARLYGEPTNFAPKDAINDHLVGGRTSALPDHGTKCAALSRHDIPAGGRVVLRYRFAPADAAELAAEAFDRIATERRAESDAFYAVLQAGLADRTPVWCSAARWPGSCGPSRSISTT